jgi:hypothetical protein
MKSVLKDWHLDEWSVQQSILHLLTSFKFHFCLSFSFHSEPIFVQWTKSAIAIETQIVYR